MTPRLDEPISSIICVHPLMHFCRQRNVPVDLARQGFLKKRTQDFYGRVHELIRSGKLTPWEFDGHTTHPG